MGRRLKGSTFSLLQFFIFTAVATILSSGLLTRDAAADPSVVAQDEVIPAVNRVAFAVDRGVLATTHTDGLRLWTTSGTLLRTFRAPGIRWIGAAAFADDRLVLAAVGWEATATAYIPVLVVWDTFSGAVRSVARLPEAEPPAGAVEEGDVDIAFVDGQIRVARLDRVLFVNPQTHEVREVARRTPPAPVGLRRMFDHPQYVFERSGGSARAQVVAPAGAYVLTQGGQEAAQLWSTETARVVADMPGSPSHVRPVALTRDGRRALVLGLGWRVLFWKTDSGTPTMLDPAAISPHRVFSDEIGPEFLPSIGELSPAGDLAFITDVASAAIVIADTDTGQVVGRLPGRGVSGLFVAPNGRFLAARGPAGIEVWDIGRRSLIGRIGTRETPAFLGSSVDGRRLLSVSRSASRAVLWDIDGFRQFAQFSVPSVDRPGARTEFSATDDLRYLMRYALFDARYDRPTDIDPITMWDTQAGIVAPADRPAAMQRAVATSRGSWFLVFNCVGRDDGFLYPNGGHHPVDMLFNQRGRCIRLPDGRTDIFLRQESGGDERVVFESGQDRRPVARLPFAQHRSFNFSRDGAYLVVREWLDWRFWIIDLSTGVEIGPAQDGPATEGDIAITSFGAILSPERGYLGNRRRDGRLGIFDLRTGAMRQDLNIAGNVVDVSRNGTFLLVSARNSRFAVVNSRTGERHAFIQERSDNGFSIAARYLEDRCRIQTVVPGFGMTIWNALTGEPLASISTSDKATGETNGADGSPALIAILPSGHYAATPGGEARLRVTEGLTSHPIDAYRARFNRPDLVMAVLRGTSCDGRPASAQPARR